MSQHFVFPVREGLTMPKSRSKTRANKKLEQNIERRNAFGMCDPTPFEAIKNIRTKQLRERRDNRWNVNV